jgi:NADPH2:quinone reductase
MRAIVFDRYGGPEVLHEAELPTPVPARGQLLLRVAAAAVNPADHKWRSGMFSAMVPIPLPHVLGYDVAGVVAAVGEGVTAFAPGDKIAALLNPITKGGYAEQVAVDAASAARIPEQLDFATAAAVPCACLTGTQLVEEVLRPQPGQIMLLTGATGSVGVAAMVAARRRGAKVIAAVRSRQIARARELGASDAVVLGDQDWRGGPLDGVLDTVGGANVAKLCLHVRRGGRICTAATDPIDPTGLPAVPEFVAVHPDGQRLAGLLEDVAAGHIPIRIAHRLPLAHAAEAQRLVERGGLEGKVILETGR